MPASSSSAAPSIGVFALQGDVREHVHALTRLGVDAFTVRRPEELARCDGLVLPGGESTTMYKLARTFDLFEPLARRIDEGMPTFGTCAGMIMLADRIEDGAPGIAGFGRTGGVARAYRETEMLRIAQDDDRLGIAFHLRGGLRSGRFRCVLLQGRERDGDDQHAAI